MVNLLLDPNSLMMIAGIVVGLNMILSGISKVLEVIKDKTATKADNMVFDFISKITGLLGKIIDWIAPRSVKKD